MSTIQLPPKEEIIRYNFNSDRDNLMKTVCQYFEDCGLTGPIDTFNILAADMFEPEEIDEKDDKSPKWSLEFIRQAHSHKDHVIKLLSNLYELSHRYHYSGISEKESPKGFFNEPMSCPI